MCQNPNSEQQQMEMEMLNQHKNILCNFQQGFKEQGNAYQCGQKYNKALKKKTRFKSLKLGKCRQPSVWWYLAIVKMQFYYIDSTQLLLN